jgi:hypothetical protein
VVLVELGGAGWWTYYKHNFTFEETCEFFENMKNQNQSIK